MITYLIFVNILGFLVMGYDKGQAKDGVWRIREMHLFALALAGGAAGVYAGMQVFRHKTRHYSFKLGIPFIAMLNFLIIYLVNIWEVFK